MLSTVQVTGTLTDATQAPVNGSVTFTPATGLTDAYGNPVVTSITDPGGHTVIAMTGVTEKTDAGQFSIDLIPDDTAGLSPAGWMYQVTVSLLGVPDYSILCHIPSTPNPVDLSQLVPFTEGAETPSEWDLTVPAGSDSQQVFTLTVPGTPTPYDITGATWEYVVRASATDTGSPLISITTTGSAAGVITVTETAETSQVLLDIYPAATSAQAPGIYFHCLWQNPGTPSAVAIASGQLIIEAVPQP